MENKCPKCGEFVYYCEDNTIEPDGDILWVNSWCRCYSCGKCWRYVEEFTLKHAWIETEEED